MKKDTISWFYVIFVVLFCFLVGYIYGSDSKQNITPITRYDMVDGSVMIQRGGGMLSLDYSKVRHMSMICSNKNIIEDL
jgi:hypothetical protein